MNRFRNYTKTLICSCVASNTHGKARGHLSLTGTAGLAVFESPSLGQEKETYNITWSVNSHAAVTEYELFFRQRYMHHSHHTYENGTSINRNDRWNSVIVTPLGISNQPRPAPPPFPGVTRQKVSYLIRGLQPATTYEARVQAKNVHGWSKLSPVFHFTTRSNGKFSFLCFINSLT